MAEILDIFIGEQKTFLTHLSPLFGSHSLNIQHNHWEGEEKEIRPNGKHEEKKKNGRY